MRNQALRASEEETSKPIGKRTHKPLTGATPIRSSRLMHGDGPCAGIPRLHRSFLIWRRRRPTIHGSGVGPILSARNRRRGPRLIVGIGSTMVAGIARMPWSWEDPRKGSASTASRSRTASRPRKRQRRAVNILASILESTTDSVFIKDTSLRMVLCNSVLAAMVGKRPEESVGKTDIENGWDPDLVHGNPSKGITGWEQDDRAVLAGSTARPEQERQVVRGEERLFDTIKTPLRDDSGAIIGLLGVSRDITERLKTEQSLREARELLQIFIDHAPAAIAMLDRQMRYIAASRRWLADYRINRSEIIGRGHYEVFPEIPERWREIHRRCLAGAVERCEKDPFLRADGTVDWVRWEIHPWRNAAGEIGGICIFSELITEREELQQNLLSGEGAAPHRGQQPPGPGVREGPRKSVHPRQSRHRGGPRDAGSLRAHRETDFDFYPREVAEGFLADERRVMDEGRSLINQELSTELTSGSRRWGLSSKVPFYDESGRVAGLVGVSRDITGHRLAVEKQQEQAALLDIAADAIFVRDMQHRIVYWNKGAEKIYGWSRAGGDGPESPTSSSARQRRTRRRLRGRAREGGMARRVPAEVEERSRCSTSRVAGRSFATSGAARKASSR